MEEVESYAPVELDGRSGRRALPEVVVDARAQMPVAERLVKAARQVDIMDLGGAAVAAVERSLDAVAVESPGDQMEIGEAGDLLGQMPAEDGFPGEMGGRRLGVTGVGRDEDFQRTDLTRPTALPKARAA